MPPVPTSNSNSYSYSSQGPAAACVEGAVAIRTAASTASCFDSRRCNASRRDSREPATSGRLRGGDRWPTQKLRQWQEKAASWVPSSAMSTSTSTQLPLACMVASPKWMIAHQHPFLGPAQTFRFCCHELLTHPPGRQLPVRAATVCELLCSGTFRQLLSRLAARACCSRDSSPPRSTHTGACRSSTRRAMMSVQTATIAPRRGLWYTNPRYGAACNSGWADEPLCYLIRQSFPRATTIFPRRQFAKPPLT